VIHGEFDDGPRLRAIVRLAIGPDRPSFAVNFLVDTGTHGTMVMPHHLPGLRPADLSSSPTSAPLGLGGSVSAWVLPAVIWLADSSGNLVPHRLPVEVPQKSVDSGMPSLLGRDLTDQYRLVVDPANDVLTLDDPANYR